MLMMIMSKEIEGLPYSAFNDDGNDDDVDNAKSFLNAGTSEIFSII